MSTTTVAFATCGFNGYGQVNTHKDSRIINRFIEFHQSDYPEGVLFESTWSRHLIAVGKKLRILSGTGREPNELDFHSEITALAPNEEICLILLNSGDLWKLDLHRIAKSKLNFLSIESLDVGKDQEAEVPQFISATHRGFFVITSRNSVYSIPTQIGQLPEHAKVLKFVSGYEHCLVLLSTGDVFVWGGGLKGQLGLGELIDVEEPALLEALAGIKIKDVSCGGWHSCAISEIGDLYVWGWNKKGQLGIPVKYKQAIYALPELIDIETVTEVDLVNCGASHTIILTKSKRLFGSGWTEFGQLAELTAQSGFIDKFSEVSCSTEIPIRKIICGPWTSTLVVTRGTSEKLEPVLE